MRRRTVKRRRGRGSTSSKCKSIKSKTTKIKKHKTKNSQTEEGEEFRISIKSDQNSQTVNLEQV